MSSTMQSQKPNKAKMPQTASATKEYDPVCGMQIEKPDPNLTVRRNDKDYQFCSASCRGKFSANPEMFI